MDTKYICDDGKVYTMVKPPERSKWTLIFCDYFHYTPEKGKAPNWFHRKMQELCFGIKWRK